MIFNILLSFLIFLADSVISLTPAVGSTDTSIISTVTTAFSTINSYIGSMNWLFPLDDISNGIKIILALTVGLAIYKTALKVFGR